MNLRNLLAYKKAFRLTIEIFELSKFFPKEERYVLTNQTRRSSLLLTPKSGWCANKIG
ncbi:MAG: four helix bundle protein [Saprospiraceae bacterium]